MLQGLLGRDLQGESHYYNKTAFRTTWEMYFCHWKDFDNGKFKSDTVLCHQMVGKKNPKTKKQNYSPTKEKHSQKPT